MTCSNCERIHTVIRVPRDLKSAIKLAHSKISDGVLSSIGHGTNGEPFSYLARGGHWGDFVDNYFKCAKCGQLFNLHAETYHGSGGKLEAVKQIKGKLYEVI